MRNNQQSSIVVPSLRETLLLTVEAEEMRRSLKKFVVGAWSQIEPSPYIDGWCVDAICDHLTALTRGEIRFLLINIPPRHSKSTICSVLWPTWCWLHKPEDRFLCASYGLNLAIRDNLKKRNLIESKWFKDRYGKDFSVSLDSPALQFLRTSEFALSENQNAKRFFVNDKFGYQLAVSVGSTTTGEGGSKLLIDDCHAASEAHSDIERESAITWFRETWSNRMNDANKDVMIVIGQRIHTDDVSGIILKERSDWVHLNLPAEYERARKCTTVIGWKDPRTQEGELLWPERFSHETLQRYKRDLGSIGYAAQYQQTPVPATGGQFKKQWLRYFTETPDSYVLEKTNGFTSVLKSQCWRFGVMDLAISSKQTADYSVVQIYDVTPQNDLLLIEQIRDHLDNPQQQKLIKTLYVQLRPLFFKIETVGYQLALVQQLRDSPVRTGDFLVESRAPELLDKTLDGLQWCDAYLIQDDRGNYIEVEGCYVVRVMGDQKFFRFAMEKQGYCKIVRQLDESSVHTIAIPVQEYKPLRDKVARAIVAAIQMENEKILFKKGASYLEDLLPELLMFPRASHDDQVDGISMACDEIVNPTMNTNIAITSSGHRSSVAQELPREDADDERLMERQQSIARIMNSLKF
jgi:hypothetical protein